MEISYSGFLINLLFCFLLSFILGIERQYRRRALGLRTMILISMGSFMFVSFAFLLKNYGYEGFDITRIASQVVAGIGFFGAGVIIKDNKNKIKGLTTAATMWCDAAIGVLCAGGFIGEAIIATLFVLFANIVLRYVNHFVNNKAVSNSTIETFNIVLNAREIDKITKRINEYAEEDNNIEITNYIVDDDVIEFDIIIKKAAEKKINKFVNTIVDEFKIRRYEYKKTNEELDDTEEL